MVTVNSNVEEEFQQKQQKFLEGPVPLQLTTYILWKTSSEQCSLGIRHFDTHNTSGSIPDGSTK